MENGGEGSPCLAVARIGKEWRPATDPSSVIDPFRKSVVGTVPVSTAKDCDDALDAAVAASREVAAMPAYERAAILRKAADNVAARAREIGKVMARESGKALGDCITEVARSADTLRLCAEEAVRIEGEHIPMDASAIGAGKIGLALRFPVGVVAAITPFNGPVNLAAHKLGPAFAAGNAIVLKPSPKAPLCFHLFIEAVLAAGFPDGAVCLSANGLGGQSLGAMVMVSTVLLLSITLLTSALDARMQAAASNLSLSLDVATTQFNDLAGRPQYLVGGHRPLSELVG